MFTWTRHVQLAWPVQRQQAQVRPDRPEQPARPPRPAHVGAGDPGPKIVLLAADGLPLRRIARTLACSRTVVRKWSRRYCERGLPDLRDAPRSGRPRRISAVEPHSVMAAACAPPEQFGLEAHTHWSGRLLAEALIGSGWVPAISSYVTTLAKPSELTTATAKRPVSRSGGAGR